MDEQTQTLDDKITAAVREGYSMKEIADHLASSDNPEHKAWAQRYTGVNAPQEAASQPTPSVNSPLTDFVTQHPVEAGLAAVGGLAALKAPTWYQNAQEQKIAKRKLDIEERRLGAYEEQVARQGMGGQAAQTVAPQAPTLSPLEEARIETERARAESIKQKIALAEAKAAREETAAKAKAEAEQAKKAAQQKQTTGGTISETQAGWLTSSNEANLSKAIDADQKARKAKAAVPVVAQQAAVAPPAQASTVQLTPAAEVVAEGVPPAHPLEGGKQLTTGTGKPAYAGAAAPGGKFSAEYKSILDVPSTHAFIPGGQQIDTLRNALSQPTYTEQFSKRDWPTEYKGEKGSLEVSKEINRSLGRPTREEALAQGIPKEKIGEPTKGILQKVNNKSAVKVGGIVGALTAIPSLVHAGQGAQEKDVQKAYGSLVQGAGQMLGPLGAIASELFGISPEELETIRKAEQGRKVGAGRGIAPPSAYKR